MCHMFVTCQPHHAQNSFVSRLSQPPVFYSCSVTSVPCHNFLSSNTSPCPLSQLSVPCHSFLFSVTHFGPRHNFLSSVTHFVPRHNFLSSVTHFCHLSQLPVLCHTFCPPSQLPVLCHTFCPPSQIPVLCHTYLSPVTTFLSSGALNCDLNVIVEQNLESCVVTVVCVCVCVHVLSVSPVNSETVCSPFHQDWTGQLVSSLVTASAFHCPTPIQDLFLFSCHSTIKQKQTNKQQMCCCLQIYTKRTF